MMSPVSSWTQDTFTLWPFVRTCAIQNIECWNTMKSPFLAREWHLAGPASEGVNPLRQVSGLLIILSLESCHQWQVCSVAMVLNALGCTGQLSPTQFQRISNLSLYLPPYAFSSVQWCALKKVRQSLFFSPHHTTMLHAVVHKDYWNFILASQ